MPLSTKIAPIHRIPTFSLVIALEISFSLSAMQNTFKNKSKHQIYDKFGFDGEVSPSVHRESGSKTEKGISWL